MTEHFVKNCSLWERSMMEKFMENSLQQLGPHDGAVEESEESSPLRRKDRQRQSVMNRPQPPFPIPLHRSGGGV